MSVLGVLKATCWNQVVVLLVEITVINAVVMRMQSNAWNVLKVSSLIMEHVRNVHQDA